MNTYKDKFERRHIGPSDADTNEMLKVIGAYDIDTLIDQTIPQEIRSTKPLKIPKALSEHEYLNEIKQTAALNKANKSLIGQGYYGTITPSAIKRNVFENPGWYTQYTPYQAEIAQGRLEALLNFQTMVADLTGLPIANASLLDEGTAAAEGMIMCYNYATKKYKTKNTILVDKHTYVQTIDVLKTRATPLNIKIEIVDILNTEISEDVFAVYIQYPNAQGSIFDYSKLVAKVKEQNAFTIAGADILALTLIKSPGEWGADVVVGTTQRFGVPLGFGGPHAAYFATTDKFKRVIPGRIIGISVDSNDNPAYRMALQTREQHIRREKATSNICTAQALLAIMAGMYAVYHGPAALIAIAEDIHLHTTICAGKLKKLGYTILSEQSFDTVTIAAEDEDVIQNIKDTANSLGYNFYYRKNSVSLSFDETCTVKDVEMVCEIFATALGKIDFDPSINGELKTTETNLPTEIARSVPFLTYTIFNSLHSETKLMRYVKNLEKKDLSLTSSMIPLGSCTMKLNAATQLIPVSWPEFANIHPFTPMDQVMGYQKMITELEAYLSDITGFDACSLQPNSGAQGEYAGLLTIKAFHDANNESHRKMVLIPSSAHGTNPASAVMAGMKVVVVKCDDYGNIDLDNLIEKAEEHSENLAGLMVTYPSTHGVFEHHIKTICDTIHKHGGKVYMDGANMNAQVGLTSPGLIGADVCHLNLHKTFAIPHGGGGPGMGPICVNKSLAPFLPGHTIIKTGGEKAISAVSAAPFGSASILLISYAYIKMLGAEGLTKCSEIAILNANYIKEKLSSNYDVLYIGKEHGRVAHELILDFRPFKKFGIEVEDVAKRLMDYGFHAPTVSFPVAGTMMIEPTESEDLAEIDRFCDAMIAIKMEIHEVETGIADAEDNVLKNAPHTSYVLVAESWDHTYSREKAVFPLPWVKLNKFWPTVSRINNSHGDRNLVCTCPDVNSYALEEA